jgi:hypothetical protein
LSSIIARNEHDITPFILADLIKLYHKKVQQSIFPAHLAKALHEANDKDQPLEQKLAEFQRIISLLMPKVSSNMMFANT